MTQQRDPLGPGLAAALDILANLDGPACPQRLRATAAQIHERGPSGWADYYAPENDKGLIIAERICRILRQRNYEQAVASLNSLATLAERYEKEQ